MNIESQLINDLFVCPECGHNLSHSKQGLFCLSCENTWKFSDGVISFFKDEYFFGAKKDELNCLLNEIKNMSAYEFFNSLTQLERKYEDFNSSYCLDPSRADWTLLGDFSDKTIVDLGCGYGSISIPLSRRAKRIISIDATLERVKFLSLIANFKKINNIIPIHGDVLKLPFKEGSIDFFIMVGLLEWVGAFRSDKSPIKLQQDFLTCLNKLLSKKGELWIGIENRLNPIYFLGKTSHGDLPFTPLLPRFIADLVYRVLRNSKYRTWTYSKFEYKKLLRQAGFTDIDFFCAFPHYQFPKIIISCSEQRRWGPILKNIGLLSSRNRKYQLAVKLFPILDSLHIMGVLVPAFFIRAKRC